MERKWSVEITAKKSRSLLEAFEVRFCEGTKKFIFDDSRVIDVIEELCKDNIILYVTIKSRPIIYITLVYKDNDLTSDDERVKIVDLVKKAQEEEYHKRTVDDEDCEDAGYLGYADVMFMD